jgi:hypothetical protein
LLVVLQNHAKYISGRRLLLFRSKPENVTEKASNNRAVTHLVQLQHVHLECEAVLVSVPPQDLKQLPHGPGREPGVLRGSVDGERLAAAGLAIGEDAHVVPVHGRLDQVLQREEV